MSPVVKNAFHCVLCSFPCCYTAEFGAIKATSDGGVMLEHLISCVPGIKIALSNCGVQKVQWAENKPPHAIGTRSIRKLS